MRATPQPDTFIFNEGLCLKKEKKEEYRVQKQEILIYWKERSPFREVSMVTMETSSLQKDEDDPNNYKTTFQNTRR